MAWTRDSGMLNNIAPTQVPLAHALPRFSFDATKFPPKNGLPPSISELLKTIPEPREDRERDREEIKENLRAIMRNKFYSETARVSAARELSSIINNEEISELRIQVKELTECVLLQQPKEDELPPSLRRRR
jgi:hypothetical protein